MAVANVDRTTVVPPTGADAVAPFDWAKVNSYDWLSLGALSMSTSKVEKLKEVLVALGYQGGESMVGKTKILLMQKRLLLEGLLPN